MAVTVKRIGLWRSEVANEPGALARTLEPRAASRASLRVVMGYRFPEHQERAAIEVYPVAGARVTAAAQAAGLAPSDLACLLVEGDDRPGLGARTAARSPTAASTSPSSSPRWWAGASGRDRFPPTRRPPTRHPPRLDGAKATPAPRRKTARRRR